VQVVVLQVTQFRDAAEGQLCGSTFAGWGWQLVMPRGLRREEAALRPDLLPAVSLVLPLLSAALSPTMCLVKHNKQPNFVTQLTLCLSCFQFLPASRH